MKASVQYGDFKGTVAADVSDLLAHYGGDDFSSFSKYLNLDEERFNLVGISIYGTKEFGIELICIDKEKSTEGNEHIVKLSYTIENKEDILDILFKRLNIVLYERFDEKYPKIEEYEYAHFSDFHKVDNENEEE
jgi:hypothetical protein